MQPRLLSAEQIEQFITDGYVIIREAFPREVAREWVEYGFNRLGWDQNDPTTWKEPRVHLAATRRVDVREFAPKVWDATCDLLGGEERIRTPFQFTDGFIFNLGIGADKPWEPPSSPLVKGWHKDGDFFRHFLDSPEQGLLCIACWSDMVHRGGGTFIAPDSVGAVARYLAKHPEGVHPLQVSFGDLIHECSKFVELTGSPGDVVLHHPYMLHSTSQNVLLVPRVIINPPVQLLEPMTFNRENAEDFSPVELAVLRGLGVERLDFKATAPRERIIPPRIAEQQKRMEEEKARLAETGAG
jgi:hypothetical protein